MECADDFFRVRERIALDEHAATADRIRAIESLENRVYGRPKEREEQKQQGPSLLDIARAQLAAEAAKN